MRILIIIFSVLSTTCFSQIEKKFSGWWAETKWDFHFKKDGTFERSSMGHYGNVTYTGKYQIKLDTVHITLGTKDTHGTVNEYYIIDKEGYLIDLELLYDYKDVTAKEEIYNSRMRSEFKKKK